MGPRRAGVGWPARTGGVLTLVLLTVGTGVVPAAGQEIDHQDWTWWDEILCTVFGIGCGGAPCRSECKVCRPFSNGMECALANSQSGKCRCSMQVQGTQVYCSLSGQYCEGIVVP